MININLLPHELRPVERSTLPFVVVGAVWLLVLLWMAQSFISTRNQRTLAENELQRIENDLRSLQTTIDAVNQLEKKKDALNNRRKAIGEITSDQILWSRELYTLPELVPDKVWVDKLKVAKRTRRVEVLVPDPSKKEKGATKKEIVVKPYTVLEIQGYTLPQEGQGVDLVGVFVEAIRSNHEFAKRFKNPIFIEVDEKEYGEALLKKFQIECEISQRGEAS